MFDLFDDIPIITESWMNPSRRTFSSARDQANSLTYNAFLTFVMWMCPMPGYETTKNHNQRDITTFLLQVQKKVKNKNLALSQIYNFGADYEPKLKQELVKNHGYTYEYLDDIYLSILYDIFINKFLLNVMSSIGDKTLKRNIVKIKKGEPRDPSKVEFTKNDILPFLNESKKIYEDSISEINS